MTVLAVHYDSYTQLAFAKEKPEAGESIVINPMGMDHFKDYNTNMPWLIEASIIAVQSDGPPQEAFSVPMRYTTVNDLIEEMIDKQRELYDGKREPDEFLAAQRLYSPTVKEVEAALEATPNEAVSRYHGPHTVQWTYYAEGHMNEAVFTALREDAMFLCSTLHTWSPHMQKVFTSSARGGIYSAQKVKEFLTNVNPQKTKLMFGDIFYGKVNATHVPWVIGHTPSRGKYIEIHVPDNSQE